jgi:hypothetical protein
MAFDLTRTRYSLVEELPVAAANTVAVEGAFVKRVLASGVANAELISGTSSSELLIGFSINNNIVPGTDVVTETGTVPSTSAYTIQLSHGNLVSGQVYVYDVTTSAALAIITSGSPVAATSVLVNLTSGLLTFASGDAGISVQVRYRYNLTVAEQTIIFRERPVNAKSNTAQGTISVGRGNGNLFTDQYDVTIDFSSATALYAGANGLVTTTSTNNVLITGAQVLQVPTAADKYLGLTFNLA